MGTMESLRLYLENRQSMGKCQTLLAFLAICGVIVCVMTLVIYYNNRSKRPPPEKVEVVTVLPGITDQEVKDKKKSEEICRRIIKEDPKLLTYPGRVGAGTISTRKDRHGATHNAYWLTGNDAQDSNTLAEIKLDGCLNKIPVIIIKMRPEDGFHLNDQLKYFETYKPTTNITTWKSYDVKMSRLLAHIKDIPSLIVLEPELLWYIVDKRNSQYKWTNDLYLEQFLQRVFLIVKKMRKSWIYLDTGNPYYLYNDDSYVKELSNILLRVPGIRGFSINTFNFANSSFTEYLARDIFCKTGLHYIMDTSRNRGPFSKLPSDQIQKCLFDPPGIAKGAPPGWSWGSRNYSPNERIEGVLTKSMASNRMAGRTSTARLCMRKSSTNKAQDANVWLKTPGLSDGRMFGYGSYHSCLIGHNVQCDDTCPMLRYDGWSNEQYCQCVDF